MPLRPDRVVVMAMVCAAAVVAQFIAGKATRDALFLANLEVTWLPAMVMATAIVSIAFVTASSKGLRFVAPGTFVPLIFVVSAGLLLLEWLLLRTAPQAAAVVVYLQISGIGPMLGSGFWLVATERFDPRTAKRRFGQIAGAGTLGGLLGGIVAERVAVLLGVGAMLPVLAAFNLLCAWLVRRLAASDRRLGGARAVDMPPDLAAQAPRSGLRVLREAPYLRNLAALVVLGTFSAALLDYLFKAQAVAAFGRDDSLLRFFAVYYSGVSLITFALQAASSRLALERFGLGVTTGTPSLATVVGGVAGLAVPGFTSMLLARGAESVFRGGLFRSGYELFYTPIPTTEKRAAKSLIDVGADRLGDAVGGGVILVILMLAPFSHYAAILVVAIGVSCAALFFATRLNRGYIQTLERSLLNRALELDFSDVEDLTTRTVMLRTIRGPGPMASAAGHARAGTLPSSVDPELADILTLRSRDRERIVAVLRHEEGVPATLVPHVIPLLAWDPVSDEAIHALRKVAEERVGELIDALLDPNQPFAVRRRLARVFSVCVSQRAADGLLLGLDDQRFEVRFQCGRSLVSIIEKNPRIRIDRDSVYRVVLREVAVGRSVWESHRLLDRIDTPDGQSFVDEFVKGRASQGLGHVFTLLSLVLPAEPLHIAYQGLQTADEHLRGTALEYLEGVLPPVIRGRLWPFLEDSRAHHPAARPRDEILEDLLRSHPSILLNLEELKRRHTPPEPWQTT